MHLHIVGSICAAAGSQQAVCELLHRPLVTMCGQQWRHISRAGHVALTVVCIKS